MDFKDEFNQFAASKATGTNAPAGNVNYKEKFSEYYHQYITRDGADALWERLNKNDFFIAPASTKYHLCVAGGLVQHSVNVFEVLKDHWEGTEDMESMAICGLLHDICKANFYKPGSRNVKDEVTGKWEKVPTYNIDDQFPFGHGEKSVYLISQFMRLSTEEALAIRWHMGGFDDSVKGGAANAISQTYNKYPLAVKLHLADLEATYLRETEESK